MILQPSVFFENTLHLLLSELSFWFWLSFLLGGHLDVVPKLAVGSLTCFFLLDESDLPGCGLVPHGLIALSLSRLGRVVVSGYRRPFPPSS